MNQISLEQIIQTIKEPAKRIASFMLAATTLWNVLTTTPAYSHNPDTEIGRPKYKTEVKTECKNSPTEEWVARYNGPSNYFDRANAIAVDGSGNVYVTGKSKDSVTAYDYATIKYNSSGAEQWVARYNGPGNSSDEANAIALDASGNVYVTGGSYDSGGDDYATIKYDPLGAEQWVARYNGPGNSSDEANAIALDASDNVYVTGGSDSGWSAHYATIKYNPSGAEQWVARYSNDDFGYAHAIALDASSNVYITGYSDEGLGTDCDYATIKYNHSGAEQWVARYNGPDNSSDGAKAIALDISGNVYVTGSIGGSNTSDAFDDYATIKYNPSGAEQWVAKYNGPSNNCDKAKAIAVDDSGNVYVTGDSYDSGGDDYATIKYDPLGTEQWVARYDWSGKYDEAEAIALDASGNVYVTGSSYDSRNSWDYATIKYNSSGAEQWVARYNGPDNSSDGANAIALDASGNVYVTGSSYDSLTDHDYATIKYSHVGIEEKLITDKDNIWLKPTVSNGMFATNYKGRVDAYDITGKKVSSQNSDGVINLEELASGIYFLKLEGNITRKVTKVNSVR